MSASAGRWSRSQGRRRGVLLDAVTQNDLRGRGEIVGDEIGRGRELAVAAAHPGAQENRAQAGAARHLDVAGLVADHPRAAHVKVELGAGALGEPGRGLAAGAFELELGALAGVPALGVVW